MLCVKWNVLYIGGPNVQVRGGAQPPSTGRAYSTREAHFANYTNKLKLQIGATHTSRYMSVHFWSAVIEIFCYSLSW